MIILSKSLLWVTLSLYCRFRNNSYHCSYLGLHERPCNRRNCQVWKTLNKIVKKEAKENGKTAT